MNKIEFEAFIQNPSRVRDYNAGIDLLVQSGVFSLLASNALPNRIQSQSPNYVAEQAFEAARSIGYSDAISDMIYLIEKNRIKLNDGANLKAMFGAEELAIERGYIKKGELDGLK